MRGANGRINEGGSFGWEARVPFWGERLVGRPRRNWRETLKGGLEGTLQGHKTGRTPWGDFRKERHGAKPVKTGREKAFRGGMVGKREREKRLEEEGARTENNGLNRDTQLREMRVGYGKFKR